MRVTHWLIALSIAVLSVTGLYIGHPFITVSGPAGSRFVMGWVKVDPLLRRVRVHHCGAAAHHLDVHRQQVRALGQVHSGAPRSAARLLADAQVLPVRCCASRPGFVGHNPLAGLDLHRWSSACTSLADRHRARCCAARAPTSTRRCAWFASLAPLFGGLQIARWIHHVVMWLLLGFAVHHVYSAVLMSTVEANAHDRVDLLGLQVRAARGPEYSGLPLHQPQRRGR